MIIFLTSLPYVSDFKVGSHRIYEGIKNNREDVVLVSLGITIAHLLKRNWMKMLARNFKQKEGCVIPLSLLVPRNTLFLRSEILMRWWWILSPRLLWIYFNRSKVNTIYVDVPHYLPYACLLCSDVIYRVSDNYSAFHYWTNACDIIEKKYLARVRKIVLSSKSLLELPKYDLENVIVIENGVSRSQLPSKRAVLDREARKKCDERYKKVIYVGSLESWFDWKLINKLGVECKEMEFDLFGPVTGVSVPIKLPGNVKLKGPIDSRLLAEKLLDYDIGIIPFNIIEHKDLIEHVVPLKLFEYLGAGLRVVSTKWSAVDKDLIGLYLADNNYEFISLIKDCCNDEISLNDMLGQLEQHYWDNKVMEIFK